MELTSENIESLSGDMLEDHFKNTFLSIQLVLSIIGFQRAKIKRRFVTSPSALSQCYSAVFWMVNLYCVLDYVFERRAGSDDPVYIAYYTKVGLLFNTLVNAEIARRNLFSNGYLNSQLYVKLQKIDRIIQFQDSKKVNYYIFVQATALMVLASIFWVVYVSVFMTKITDSFSLSGLLAATSGIPIHVENTLCFYIIYFVNKRVKYVNKKLRKACEEKTELWCFQEFKNNSSDKRLTEKMVSGIESILDTLADFVKLFQFPILSTTGQLLLWDLIVMQSIITGVKEQIDGSSKNFYIVLTSSVSVIALTVTAVTLCMLSQLLINNLTDTQTLCKKIMSSTTCCEKSRARAECALLLLDTAKFDFSVYGIISLNLSLPFNLIAITTTYAVVLLQFAFLN